MAWVENGPGTLVLGAADRVAAIAAVKARLRVANGDEEALIAAFAETALGLCERVIGQATIARTMAQAVAVPSPGGWQRLAAAPVGAITAVTDAAGNALAPDTYRIDIDADGAGWVRIDRTGAATVAFTAGLAASWELLPPAIREGAAMLAAHLFDDRTGREPVPAAVTALWRPFRTMTVLGGRLLDAADRAAGSLRQAEDRP